MATPTLVIFVDAYPFHEADELTQRLSANIRAKVTPGIGYSINVKSELFGGLMPDDVGYFCEWNYTGQREHKHLYRPVVSALKLIGKINHFSSRVAHRLARYIVKDPVYAIPFDMLPYLKNSGPTAYERDFRHNTFLDDGNFHRVLYSEHQGKDRNVFAAAKEVLKTERPERLFIATAELDSIMHAYGMDSLEYREQLKLIDSEIGEIVDQFQELHGQQATYFVFSDHGMAPVVESVDFPIESIAGPSSPSTYGYFVDATFFRIWTKDKKILQTLTDALNQLGKGRILDEDERAFYGISDMRHGNIVYMLDEGKMFAPSFFGPTTCKAMHGYQPDLDSQQGILLSNSQANSIEQVQARGLYQLIKTHLNG